MEVTQQVLADGGYEPSTAVQSGSLVRTDAGADGDGEPSVTVVIGHHNDQAFSRAGATRATARAIAQRLHTEHVTGLVAGAQGWGVQHVAVKLKRVDTRSDRGVPQTDIDTVERRYGSA